MSKWGFVDKGWATRVSKGVAGERIQAMSLVILDLERDVSALKDEVISAERRLRDEMQESYELHGYITRVKEQDKLREETP